VHLDEPKTRFRPQVVESGFATVADYVQHVCREEPDTAAILFLPSGRVEVKDG
jgi:hypothetical protein